MPENFTSGVPPPNALRKVPLQTDVPVFVVRAVHLPDSQVRVISRSHVAAAAPVTTNKAMPRARTIDLEVMLKC